jgi:hypothetical protein
MQRQEVKPAIAQKSVSFSLPPLPRLQRPDIKNNPKFTIASMDPLSLLHNSCKLYPDTIEVIESALQLDEGAIRRPISIVCSGPPSKEERNRVSYRRTLERFSYPVNIALKYQAPRNVIEYLIQQGPDVASYPDGLDQAGTLAIALGLDRHDVIDTILHANPDSASILDRHSNYPLHVAAKSSPLAVVQAVHAAHPVALEQRNFSRETPLDIAVRSSNCPEEVLDYLQHSCFGEMEDHLDDLE